MTFLGLEQPVAYGRQQVFDPTTAQMVLNANRDYINAVYRDYQQAMADMKEFNEKYGDFTSPIQADMDWYYNNVTGRVKNFINDLYARGIDPLRSQEGRAAIARELATMPTKGIAQVRQSAETAKEYIKTMGALAAQGKYNADLERMAGRDLSTWNTMGDPENGIKASGIWGYSSPTEYKDLNQFTGHIFDKMADEYIRTIDGYDYSGVSRERRENALTSQLGGLINTDLGRFHYAQSKSALENRLGRPVSDAEAMEAFKQDILTSTTEYEHRKREENKEYARQREFAYANKLDAAKKARDYYYDILPYADTDGDGKLSQEERANFAKAKQQSLNKNSKSSGVESQNKVMNVVTSGLNKAASGNSQVNLGYENIGNNIAKEAIKFGNEQLQNFKNQKDYSLTSAYVHRYGSEGEMIDAKVFDKMFEGRTRVNNVPSGAIANTGDIKRLSSTTDIVQRTLGSHLKYNGNSENGYEDSHKLRQAKDKYKDNLVISHEDGTVYTAPMKDGTVRSYVKVHLYSATTAGRGEDLGTAYYEIYRSVKNPYIQEGKKRVYSGVWSTDLDREFEGYEDVQAMVERGSFGTDAKSVNQDVRLNRTNSN